MVQIATMLETQLQQKYKDHMLKLILCLHLLVVYLIHKVIVTAHMVLAIQLLLDLEPWMLAILRGVQVQLQIDYR